MKVNLDEIIDAIDQVNGEEDQYYYDPKNGKVIYDADEPEDGWILLPTHSEIDDYGTMEHFIDQVDDPEKQEWLRNAIHGKGAFRRFRSTLERFKMEDDWYDYLDKTHKEIAMEWCEDHGFEYDLTHRESSEEENDISFDEDAFLHGDDYREPEREAEQEKIENPGLRIVPITTDNYMRLLFMKKDVMNLIAKEEGINVRYNEDDAQEELEDEMGSGMKLYAASESGRFIGYACQIETYGQSELREIYVVKDRRRQGVGSFLLRHADEIAEDRLVLSVHPLNTEYTAFARKLGFNHAIRIVYAREEEN